MQPFTPLTSRLVPLLRTNIDTDQIIPASFLKSTHREGLGRGLFAHWRFDGNGERKPDFILNRAEYAGAQILLAGDNFGCGSSREHAPWALLDYGFRVVVSASFADIFKGNAGKNGLLAAVVSSADHAVLAEFAETTPQVDVTVDLETSSIEGPGFGTLAVEVEPFARHCLLNGVDQLDYLLDHQVAIAGYEADHPQSVSTFRSTTGQETE